MYLATKPPKRPTVSATHLLIGRNDLAQVFRVHARRERRRADQVGEHHRDLSALGALLRLLFSYYRLRRYRNDTHKFTDRTKYFQPIPERDAEVFKMLIGQVREDRQIDAVFGEALRILGHAERFKPRCNLLQAAALPF